MKRLFYEIITLFEYTSFAYILWLNTKNRRFRSLIIAVSIAYIVFLIFYHFNAPFTKIDSVPIGVETIFILAFSFYFLYEQMKDPGNMFIYNDYRFWIVLGFTVYLAGSFFIYILANQIPDEELHRYWFLTNIFATLKNIFFAISIWIHSKKKSQLQFA